MNNLSSKVYEYLTLIPKGRVSTYKDIAEYLGNPKLCRVVGNILHVNPDPLNYPCFRIVNHEGRLAKNFGDSLAVQRQRLIADGIEVIDDRVDLERYGWTYDKK